MPSLEACLSCTILFKMPLKMAESRPCHLSIQESVLAAEKGFPMRCTANIQNDYASPKVIWVTEQQLRHIAN